MAEGRRTLAVPSPALGLVYAMCSVSLIFDGEDLILVEHVGLSGEQFRSAIAEVSKLTQWSIERLLESILSAGKMGGSYGDEIPVNCGNLPALARR